MSDLAVRRARRLRITLGINVVIVVAQVVLGFSAHSLGLLADAAHNLTDVVGLALALAAVQFARRPATMHRSYGWHRGPILAAQANAAMILAVTVWILVEGGRRLADPPKVHGLPVLVIALVAFAANAGAAWVIREPHRHGPGRGHDLNMHGALLHLLGDAAASLGVAVAGAVVLATDGWYWLDPAVSILIGLSIGRHAWRLLRSSNAILLEGAPDWLDPVALRAEMIEVRGVHDVHDLHVWAIGSELTALSAHVVVDGCDTLTEAREVIDQLRARLRDQHGITHSTLELEAEACAAGDEHCELEPTTPAAVAPHAHAGHHGHPHERH